MAVSPDYKRTTGNTSFTNLDKVSSFQQLNAVYQGEYYCDYLKRQQFVDYKPQSQCYSTTVMQFKTISGLFTLLGLLWPQVCESNTCV